jgi:hypothetical protein
MNILSGFVHKIVPYAFKDSSNLGLPQRSYGQLRLILFLVMIAIAMGR